MKRTSKLNIKKILKSVSGMTYVELLTALALLALIITTFTPMLLSSYESIYEAGLETQKVYESKTQLEEGLARRDSTKDLHFEFDFDFDTTESLAVSAEGVFTNIKAAGYKVISTSREGLETIFGHVVPRIELISPKTVYDDRTYHDIVLQTYGLKYEKVSSGKLTDDEERRNLKNTLTEGEIYIEAVIPNKNDTENDTTTTDSTVYDYGYKADVQYFNQDTPTSLGALGTGSPISNETDAGRIKLRINSPEDGPEIDFTYSPIKIRIYYLNRRGFLKELSTYLFIDPPTIMFAGQTNSETDYFTSAGVEEVSKSTSNSEGEDLQGASYVFNIESRRLRTDNSSAFNSFEFGAPGDQGVVIRNIKWIDNDETQGLKPYYVMVGTKGAIYRMYNYSSHSTDIFKLSTFSEFPSMVDERGNSVSYTYGYGTVPAGGSVIDKQYDLTDGTRVYSSLWSGDSTHYFDFSSWSKSTNYGLDEEDGNDNCWFTAEQHMDKDGLFNDVWRNLENGADCYNLFGMQAKFSYYYNGPRTGFNYNTQTGRNISYILTEYGSPFRLFGFMKEEDDFAGFTEIWYKNYNGSGYFSTKSRTKAETHPDWIGVFDGSPESRHIETNFASLRFLHMGSYDPNYQELTNFFRTDGEATDDRDTARQITKGHDDLGGLESEINLTDAIYIPKAGSTNGTMFYLGNITAYMNVSQKDNLSTVANRAASLENRSIDKKYGADSEKTAPHGALTDYVIFGDKEGTGTSVYKYSSNTLGYSYMNTNYIGSSLINESGSKDANTNGVSVSEKQSKTSVNSTNKLNDDARRNFFINRVNSWQDMFMEDVLFTMGYASVREKVYTNVTYNGTTDLYRSYEHFYFQSHYGIGGYDEDGLPLKVGSRATVKDESSGNGGSATKYLNSYNNDYYNVWFPGEMYNLTNVATKDGVTVAVGYAVSGSTYQWVNPNQTTNTSTALGGIYNDGVLAAMIEGEDSAFTNLLYFKDNATMDLDYLTAKYSGTEYDNTLGQLGTKSYGTHDRRSIQFTAVDLLVENQKTSWDSDNIDVSYYAYYGDNTGRVFRSLVAKGKGKNQSTEDQVNEATITGLKKVSYIKDLTFVQPDDESVETLIDHDVNALNEKVNLKNEASEMYEIKTHDGKSLQYYFKNIGTIDISGTNIIITGEMSPTSGGEYIIVGIKEDGAPAENGGYNFYAVKNGNFTDKIYDAEVIGGYYYITGRGWIAAVSVDTLCDAAKSDDKIIYSVTDGSATNKSSNKNMLLWADTGGLEIYAVAGRDTQ